MRIRPEQTEDLTAVREVNLGAFEGTTEADLVDALREQSVRECLIARRFAGSRKWG